MVLGPMGCGKSTLLATLARDHATRNGVQPPTPAVFIRLRLPSSQAPLPTSVAEEHKLMDSAAAEVFRPIGYPPRRALVFSVPGALYRDLALIFGPKEVDLTSPSSQRACDALRLLFDVLEQLCHERERAGVPRVQAAPVLLLDEVRDLVKSPRLAELGGRAVFDTLAQLLVMYCVDRRVVRAAVSGSSAALSMEFDRTVASGSCWRYYELRDPEEGAVLDALRVQGYTADEAAQLVSLCGTRLRLLEPALAQGAARVRAHDLMATGKAVASRHFYDLFRRLKGTDAALMLRVLDQAEAAEASGGAPPKLSADGMSDALLAQASKVLHVRLNGSLVFQSKLHRAVWPRVREELVPPS